MTPEELHDLIVGDEAATALADAGNDVGCAERCRAIAPKVVQSRLIGELGILNLYDNPVDAETVLQTIEAVAAVNTLVARIWRWMRPNAPGADFGDPRIRAALTAPTQAGGIGLTAEQAAPLLAAAEVEVPITANDVSAAWAEYRVMFRDESLAEWGPAE